MNIDEPQSFPTLKFRAWSTKEKRFLAEGFHMIGECTLFDILNQHKFVIKNKITCAEALYQVDSINEQLPEIMDKLCQIAGYYVGPKENKQ